MRIAGTRQRWQTSEHGKSPRGQAGGSRFDIKLRGDESGPEDLGVALARCQTLSATV
jgi:hypothetical protein